MGNVMGGGRKKKHCLKMNSFKIGSKLRFSYVLPKLIGVFLSPIKDPQMLFSEKELLLLTTPNQFVPGHVSLDQFAFTSYLGVSSNELRRVLAYYKRFATANKSSAKALLKEPGYLRSVIVSLARYWGFERYLQKLFRDLACIAYERGVSEDEKEPYLKAAFFEDLDRFMARLRPFSVSKELFYRLLDMHQNPELEHVDFSSSHLTDSDLMVIFMVLKGKKRLRTLNFRDNAIGDKGLFALTENSREFPSLRVLDLSKNNISDQGVRALASSLYEDLFLKTLDISDNRISDKGAKFLAEALYNNQHLKKLNLSNNRISEKGLSQYAYAFSQNSSIETLDISQNPIGPNLAPFCKGLILNKGMTYLDISGSQIGAQGLALLKQAALFHSGKTPMRVVT